MKWTRTSETMFLLSTHRVFSLYIVYYQDGDVRHQRRRLSQRWRCWRTPGPHGEWPLRRGGRGSKVKRVNEISHIGSTLF